MLRVPLYSPDWPGTACIDCSGLRLTEICLFSVLPRSAQRIYILNSVSIKISHIHEWLGQHRHGVNSSHFLLGVPRVLKVMKSRSLEPAILALVFTIRTPIQNITEILGY